MSAPMEARRLCDRLSYARKPSPFTYRDGKPSDVITDPADSKRPRTVPAASIAMPGRAPTSTRSGQAARVWPSCPAPFMTGTGCSGRLRPGRSSTGPAITLATLPHLGQPPAPPLNEKRRPQKHATSVIIDTFLSLRPLRCGGLVTAAGPGFAGALPAWHLCPPRGAEFLTGNVGGARVPSLPGRPLVRASGAWLRTGWLRALGSCWSAVTGSNRRSSVCSTRPALAAAGCSP
jgi:hypothetical protein